MKENNKTYDEKMMLRCFELARKGESYTAPNPMVGAVLVHDGRIIGEGYHQRYGEAHAEVNCINSVKAADRELIPLSTLYVSLEPCSHHGKTPPCTDLILRHKIPKVVISVQDDFHLVNGAGIQKLRDNQVNVVTGVEEEKGRELIRHFLYFHQKKTPYITLKFAQTKDGYMGIEGKRIAISNELSGRYVHQLRAQHQAILVGKNTVLTDDPQLSVRLWKGKNPIRMILGNEKGIPADYHIFDGAAKTIFLGNTDDSMLSLPIVLQQLYELGIISVLVEGGAHTLQEFIDQHAWNEAHVIRSDKEMRMLSTAAPDTFIRAPKIAGKLTQTIPLENDTVQLLKNPDAVSIT